jgi:hypothetical protein
MWWGEAQGSAGLCRCCVPPLIRDLGVGGGGVIAAERIGRDALIFAALVITRWPDVAVILTWMRAVRVLPLLILPTSQLTVAPRVPALAAEQRPPVAEAFWNRAAYSRWSVSVTRQAAEEVLIV